ncbi:hypothetical protein CDD81_4046 [Ophiocordyceps australis]|uniref:Uncharacterized protein n=1 Tax=Ophiocordyceps australis TaxID=1399860 RepID=A0A2C5YCU8_9HYPO|nr:hypothetical protein CDD81_4046 [Ophiocordyceps australis]
MKFSAIFLTTFIGATMASVIANSATIKRDPQADGPDPFSSEANRATTLLHKEGIPDAEFEIIQGLKKQGKIH